jgi:uncharacterized membrane protein (DUF485 family)
MSQTEMNSRINKAIDFIGEFFSELSPQALAIIISISTLGLYAVIGVVAAGILGFLTLFITKNGITIIILCTVLIIVFIIYGLIMAIKNYKKIILGYEQHKP